VDFEIQKQLALILRHKNLEALNADWSSLYYLVQSAQRSTVVIRILNVKWEEIESSILLDEQDALNSVVARKISDEFNIPGNAPFSIIIGNYQLDVSNKYIVNTLSHIAKISASVFAPFITSITPEIFGTRNFSGIETIELRTFYATTRCMHLKTLADSVYANFIGLVVPRILFPSLLNINQHKKNYCPVLGTEIKDFNKIWGNAAYAFVAVIMKSFVDTGWFLDITGMPREDNSGQVKGLGSVPELRSSTFFDNTAIPFGFFQYVTEYFVSEKVEQELKNLGLISLCQIKNRDFAVVYNACSLKNSTNIDLQSLLSNSLSHVLCVSRFAHYIKILARQKIGLYSNLSDLQHYLNNWLYQYISSDVETSLDLKYRYPLRAAKVELLSQDKFNESVRCKISLTPHLKSAQIITNIVLQTYVNNH
jgi:type VI secretion system protein ImpD